MLGRMFGIGEAINALDYIEYLYTYGILFIIGIICATKLPEKLLLKKENNIVSLFYLLLVV